MCRASGARRHLPVEELALHAGDRRVERGPMIGRLGLGDMDAAARRMDLDLDPRLAIVLGENHLRVMGAPDELDHFFHQVPGVRAKIVIHFGVPQAAASMFAIPHPSFGLGKTTAQAWRNNRCFSSSGTYPRNRTASFSPSSVARRSRRGRSSPCPQMSNVTSARAARAIARARSANSTPL